MYVYGIIEIEVLEMGIAYNVLYDRRIRMGKNFYIGEIEMVDRTKKYIIGCTTQHIGSSAKELQDKKYIANYVELNSGLLTRLMKKQFNAQLFNMVFPMRTVYLFQTPKDASAAIEYLDSIVEVANKLGGLI